MLIIGCMEKWSRASPREISLLASALLVPVSSDQHWDTFCLALNGVIPLKMTIIRSLDPCLQGKGDSREHNEDYPNS